MARRTKKRRSGRSTGTLDGFSDWASEHYILTYLLAGSVISCIYVGISNLTSKSSTK